MYIDDFGCTGSSSGRQGTLETDSGE